MRNITTPTNRVILLNLLMMLKVIRTLSPGKVTGGGGEI